MSKNIAILKLRTLILYSLENFKIHVYMMVGYCKLMVYDALEKGYSTVSEFLIIESLASFSTVYFNGFLH